ncbi:hypothetical protein DTL70_04740 [Streptomyces diacarni]|uniref:Uncharacterized protein n=1 Tax=Streptomyces diacarni TaxID=2800381 RepID=A0A367FBC1_9ACTN|nr:hypothetical protein DTL70_04740 [Streptomyces diacarni]
MTTAAESAKRPGRVTGGAPHRPGAPPRNSAGRSLTFDPRPAGPPGGRSEPPLAGWGPPSCGRSPAGRPTSIPAGPAEHRPAPPATCRRPACPPRLPAPAGARGHLCHDGRRGPPAVRAARTTAVDGRGLG